MWMNEEQFVTLDFAYYTDEHADTTTHMSMQILIPKTCNVILFLSLGTPTRKNKIL